MLLDGDLLKTIFGSEEDLDLSAIIGIVEKQESKDEPVSDEDLEAFMRAQWGLPSEGESTDTWVRDLDRGGERVTPDDGVSDDYTDDEWRIVETMRKYCLDAIKVDANEKARDKAISWCFTVGTEDARNGVSFHLACEMLRSRPWVVQCLIQHFWMIRSITPKPLPFMADFLPEALQSEAIFHAWEGGSVILHALWKRPGCLVSELRAAVVAQLGDAEFDRAFAKLLDVGLAGVSSANRAYVTSRPAHFRKKSQRTSWSKTFIGD